MKLRDLLAESIDIPGVLYHLTTKELLPLIKQHGLLPQDAAGEWAHIGYKQKTFFVDQKDEDTIGELLAMMLGKHGNFEEWDSQEWATFYDKWVLLTVLTSRVPGLVLEPDPSGPGYFMTSTPIPSNAIIGIQTPPRAD